MNSHQDKKVLIITYYWPPAGGPGVQRWLKFVKYLGAFGVSPVVYVPANPNYPLIDPGLSREVPKEVKIFKQPIFEPYKIASIFSRKGTKSMSRGLIREKELGWAEKTLLWIRGNLFIPDARKFWVNPSVKYLGDLLGKEDIETVITTGPPHSLHLIGLRLKAKFNIKWMADFRDPWTTIGYHEKLRLGKRAGKLHKKLEKEVLETADVVIATSNTTAGELERIAKRPVVTITNGYDEIDRVEHPPSSKFVLSHIGSLLSGRDPQILWEALNELAHEIEGFKGDLEIRLVGAVSDDVLHSAEEAGLKPYLKLLGYVAHEEALKLQQEARVLLLLEIDAPITRGIIPGKLFEYMSANRPVVAIGPEQWEAGRILEATGSGRVFTYTEKQALITYLKTLYGNYRKGIEKPETTNISKYSRKSLTGELAKLIKTL